jgi:hypothetical protein
MQLSSIHTVHAYMHMYMHAHKPNPYGCSAGDLSVPYGAWEQLARQAEAGIQSSGMSMYAGLCVCRPMYEGLCMYVCVCRCMSVCICRYVCISLCL